MDEANKSLSVKSVSFFMIFFLLTVLILPGVAADLPFDPNDYTFLVYNPEGEQPSIEDAMIHLEIPYVKRNFDNKVTADDLATYDILIIGENYYGDVSGLDANILEAGITGRVLLTGHDPDQHLLPPQQIEAAKKMFVQSIYYILKGGKTGMIALACTPDFSEPFPYLPEDWNITPQLIPSPSEDVNHLTPEGLQSGVYEGLDPCDLSNWDLSNHDTFTIVLNWGFVPFELNNDGNIITLAKTKPSRFALTKTDDANDCVYPWNVTDENYLNYNICYDPCGYSDSNVVIIDKLPNEVDYYSSNPAGYYDSNDHTVTWFFPDIDIEDANCVTLTVKVNYQAKPGGIIKNRVKIEGDNFVKSTSETTCIDCYAGRIIYVDKDANGFNNGISWNNAYTDLRDALKAAQNCSTTVTSIWVAQGTYKPTQNPFDNTASFNLIENLKLFGHFDGNETNTNQRNFSDYNNITILDGRISEDFLTAVRNVVTAEYIDNAVLDGFTITNAYDFMGNSSGIYLNDASAKITNCEIKNNYYSDIQAVNASCPDIHNCIISGIGSTQYGVYLTTGSVSNISGSTILNHTSDGIHCNNSTLTVSSTAVKNNISYGIYCNNSDTNIAGCIIRSNGNYGLFISNPPTATEPVIKNNWICKNNHGIYLSGMNSKAIVHNNTIISNNDYGIYYNSGNTAADINSCIIWGHGTELQNCLAVYSCIEGGGTSNGNINTDPCFVDAANNNYHLDPNSDCIDRGNPNADYDDSYDIDGENRIVDGNKDGSKVIDIGADEYYWSEADYNTDEIVNFLDYSDFTKSWQATDANISLDSDSDVDYGDLDLFTTDWLWRSAWTMTEEEMITTGGY